MITIYEQFKLLGDNELNKRGSTFEPKVQSSSFQDIVRTYTVQDKLEPSKETEKEKGLLLCFTLKIIFSKKDILNQEEKNIQCPFIYYKALIVNK